MARRELQPLWWLVAGAVVGLSTWTAGAASFAAPTKLETVITNGQLCVRPPTASATAMAGMAPGVHAIVGSSSERLLSHLAERQVNVSLAQCF